MKYLIKNLFLSLFLVLTFSCATTPQQQYQQKMQASPVTSIAFWEKYESPNLKDKLITAPQEMIQYLQWDNLANNYPEVPKAATVSAQDIELVKAALDEIPPQVKRVINDKLVAIFLVEDLGSSALTDGIKDQSGQFKKGFIALDINALNRKANEWCTWKESSPFSSGDFSVRCTLENSKQDNRKNAIQYILLHEMGHILNIDSPHLPYWAPAKNHPNRELDSYEFVNQSWSLQDGKLIFKDSKLQNYEGKINYYSRGPKLPSEETVRIYEHLEKTNFASLYSLVHVSDDFAEAFVTYVHTELMKKPFRIEIFYKNKKVKEFKTCWKQKSCQSKLEILKKIINNE